MTLLRRAPKAPIWEPNIDTALEERARATNPDELVTLFSDEVWRFASAQVKSREDAEDIVMETFAAAFRNFSRLERADNQAHWLLGVARNKVADTYRKHYRRAEEPIRDDHVAPASDSAGVMARQVLADLPESQREVITLKYVNGLSTEEVAHLTHRTAAATNSLLQRGRQSLRAALGLPQGEQK
jgi:RNA polymerase sigma-70 factor (ECF subfamily)